MLDYDYGRKFRSELVFKVSRRSKVKLSKPTVLCLRRVTQQDTLSHKNTRGHTRRHAVTQEGVLLHKKTPCHTRRHAVTQEDTRSHKNTFCHTKRHPVTQEDTLSNTKTCCLSRWYTKPIRKKICHHTRRHLSHKKTHAKATLTCERVNLLLSHYDTMSLFIPLLSPVLLESSCEIVYTGSFLVTLT